MVVVATANQRSRDAAGLEFECRRFGALEADRVELVEWLKEQQVAEIVMESTALYWKPVWLELEPHFAQLHLAQAHSNRAPKGRKDDFRDAKRLIRRLLAGELMLSFVPAAEQRSWRELARTKDHYVHERARLQSRVEALLECGSSCRA
jgi:transposase